MLPFKTFLKRIIDPWVVSAKKVAQTMLCGQKCFSDISFAQKES